MITPVIYKSEQEDGLSDKISKNNIVAYASKLVPSQTFDLTKVKNLNIAKATNNNQMDLFYLTTVLASVGWNDNDDVFTPKELWAARNTPEDKPVNYEHSCADIIGHMTNSFVIDEQEKIIDGNLAIDLLPAKFHIATGAVLYKYWDVEDLQKRMDTIISEITKGDVWAVSMECLFSNFDYALAHIKTGELKTVARNSETSFLTKKLKAYGGNGVYNDYKIGRILKNFVFSGKGLVKNPANVNSVILDFSTASKIEKIDVCENLGYSLMTKNIEESKEMNELEQVKKDLVEAKASLAILETKTKQADELLKTADAKLKVVEDEKTVLVKELDTVKASLVQIEKDKKDVADELHKVYAEIKTEKRIQKIATELKVDVAEATKLVENFVEMKDESFNSVITAMAAKIAKPVEKKEKVSASVLENVETKSEPALNVPDENGVEVIRKSIAKYLDNDDKEGEK